MGRRSVAVSAICCRLIATALLWLPLAAPAEDKPAEKPNRVERTANKAADVATRTANRAAKFTEKTAKRSARFVEKTATRAGKFVERTADKTGNAVKRALE